MANEYMTLEQVCERLGKSVEEIRTLVAERQLSEIRDGAGVLYKTAEVEQVAAKEGSSIVDLAAVEDFGASSEGDAAFSSALSELADASSGLDLLDESPSAAAPMPAEVNLDDIPMDLPAAPAEPLDLLPELDLSPAEPEPAAAAASADDLAFLSPAVPDLGLSGSSIISLEMPAETKPTEPAKPQAPAARKGISVFDDDELEIESDPMGETQIAASVKDLDSVGSGSGLLDLTRESDDTSLGAELLDVISPSSGGLEAETEVEAAAVAEPTEDSGLAVSAEETTAETPYEAAVPTVAVAARSAAAMPGAAMLNVCSLLGVLALALVGLAAAAATQGIWPSFLKIIASGTVHYAVFGGLVLVAVVTGVVGILAGRK